MTSRKKRNMKVNGIKYKVNIIALARLRQIQTSSEIESRIF